MPHLQIGQNVNDEPRKNQYLSKNILGMARKFMKSYCLPDNKVNMDNADTGVIVALILYFIAKKSNANRIKLECYTVLLDAICFMHTGKRLFDFVLNDNCKISNFKNFFQFMIDKNLLLENGNTKFYILNGEAPNIFKYISSNGIFISIESWLNDILNKYNNRSIDEITGLVKNIGIIDCSNDNNVKEKNRISKIISDFFDVALTPLNKIALNNINQTIDKHTAENDE